MSDKLDEFIRIPCRSTASGPAGIEGATRTHCDRCGCEVWIAPSSQAVRETMPNEVVCGSCCPLPDSDDDLAVSAEQVEELVGAGIPRDEIEALHRRLKARPIRKPQA